MKIQPEVLVFIIILAAVAALSIFVSIPQSPRAISSSGLQSGQASLPVLGKAPELVGTQRWINSEPLTIEGLRGKVVLVDFWTYSCINCIRTLPYLGQWHAKYADKGLVIIGVHSPEFEFEKDYNNVKNAVEQYGIEYPVVQDNNFATWQAYDNRFWPRKYVIDKEGNIRYDHIGEGAYEETEKVIQELLGEIADVQEIGTEKVETPDFSEIGTPELYLGYDFARAQLGNAEGFSPGNIVDYKGIDAEDATRPSTIYLSGMWKNEADRVVAINNSKLLLIYKAKDVNIVAGGSSEIEVLLDGLYLGVDYYGDDIVAKGGKSAVAIDEQRLYNVVSAPSYEEHLLEIDASPGFELYTFTFG